MNDTNTEISKVVTPTKTINLPESTSTCIVKNELLDPIESIAESLKSIDQSLQKIAGEKIVKTNEPHKKSYAEKYFAKSDSTGKWEEK